MPETEVPATQDRQHASTCCWLFELFHGNGKTDAVSLAMMMMMIIIIIIIIVIIIGVVTDSCSV
jgi:hypothetical protein